MTKRSAIIFIFTIAVFFAAPKITKAFNPVDIVRIIGTINRTVNSIRVPSGPQATFPFGGRIVESETACKLNYWVTVVVFGFPVTTPGIPIPLFGTKVRVGPPGLPVSNVFTFPGITQVYPNNNEDKVGTWTLGIALKQNIVRPIIDRINTTLSTLPPISIGVATFFNFSLKCPDGGIILKIGTS